MAQLDQHKVWQPPKLKMTNAASEALLRRAFDEVSENIQRQMYARMNNTKHNLNERVRDEVAIAAKRIHTLLARHPEIQAEFRKIFWFTREQIQIFPMLLDVEPFETEGESRPSAKTPRKAVHLDNGEKISEQPASADGIHANDLSALAHATGIDISKLSPDLREDLRLANPRLVLEGPRYEASTVEAAVRMYRIKNNFNMRFMTICRALGVTKQKFWSSCLHMAIGGEESIEAFRLANEEMKLLPIPLKQPGQARFSEDVKARVIKIHTLLCKWSMRASAAYFRSIGFPKIPQRVAEWKFQEKKATEQFNADAAKDQLP